MQWVTRDTLPTAYGLLPTACGLLLTAYCLLLAAYCSSDFCRNPANRAASRVRPAKFATGLPSGFSIA